MYGLLVSERFQAAKSAAVDADGFTMSSWTDEAGRTVVQTVRRMGTARLPEFVKPLVDPTLTITETERWTASDGEHQPPTHADFAIDVKGAPVSFRGDLTLSWDASGTALRYAGTMTASLPLFRRQVAEAAIGPVRNTIEAEFALLRTATLNLADYLS